jgi:poly(A) polymerase
MDRSPTTAPDAASAAGPTATLDADAARARITGILTADDPTEGLWAAFDDGFLVATMPEIPALKMEQDPIHRHKDVLTHTFVVVANTPPVLRIRMAALFHDVGKPATRRFKGGKVTFHHHEAVGARMTRERLGALGFDAAFVDDVSRLVELSGRFHGYKDWADSAVRRYARDAGPLLGDLNVLVRCDCTTRNPEKVRGLQRRMDELEDRIRVLALDAARKAERPDIDGAAVMELLGIPPGPEVGAALKMLLEHKRVHGPSSPEDAEAILRAWWAARQAGSPA